MLKIGKKVSLIKVLLPEPDTPVIHINFDKGNLTSIFFKLFPDAPYNDINFPFPFLLFLGKSISFLPEIYGPVIDFLDLIISSGVPEKITLPPFSPAPGPKSII